MPPRDVGHAAGSPSHFRVRSGPTLEIARTADCSWRTRSIASIRRSRRSTATNAPASTITFTRVALRAMLTSGPGLLDADLA